MRYLYFLICFSSVVFGLFPHPASAQDTTERMVLNEQFDINNGMWPEENHDSAFAKVENGNYVFNNKMSSRFWSYRLAPPGVFTKKPNILEMKIKSLSEANNTVYGILWHTILIRHGVFDEYGFLISANGNASIVQRSNDSLIVIKTWTAFPSINRIGYNVLRIENTTSGTFRFYINESLFLERSLTDAEITTLGFYCDPHSILAIDYIKLAVK